MKLQHSNAYKNIIFNLSKLDHKFAQELRFPNEKIKKLIGNKKKNVKVNDWKRTFFFPCRNSF